MHKDFLLIYVICFDIIISNSRTSTLWKLNEDQTKIVKGSSFNELVPDRPQFIPDDDPIFNIITSTVLLEGEWVKELHTCTKCLKSEKAITKNESLDCGQPVNFTYYDNLVGVLRRDKHPHIPELLSTLIFTKKSQHFDIEALERKLRKAKRKKPRSINLYNQIGNYWRIKGNPTKAIECFRRALAASPHNSDVLLNLARMLFTLQYLDDAIYLTRRSLELQPPEKEAWQQYFTLGEILRAYGHYQEAAIHMRRALDLRPGFEPALSALKEMEVMPTSSIHFYTLLIIICLVLGVCVVVMMTTEERRSMEANRQGAARAPKRGSKARK